MSFTVSITLSAVVLSLVSAAAQVLPLPIQPVDVGYSSSLDRIVLIGKNPNQLVIFNPATAVSSAVALPKEPTSLSVSPDGRYAAVGFDALVSYINLTTGIIEKHLPVSTNPSSVLLTGNGWVHAFPNRSIAIATGAETVLSAIWLPWKASLHPNGAWVYYTRGGSPDDLIKGDVGAGAFQYLYDSKYHGDFAICGGVWFTQDGQRLITGCGTVFRTSANQTEDLIYNGTFSGTRTVQSATHNAGLRRIALVPGRFPYYPYDPQPDSDTEIQFYDDRFLTFLGRIALPELSAGVPWHGRHLFQDGAGTKLHVILQPDSNAGSAANWGVYTLSLGDGGNCAATLSTTNAGVPAAGGSISISVTAAAGCMWQATTTSNWLFVGTGGVGVGTSSVSITATANLQPTARTATVNIAGRTLTVTQAAPPAGTADPVFTLPFRPVTAEYSKALDKIVVVTEAPHTLRIVDPVARTEQTVALASTPKSLSLSPDGRYAAVGHDGWVSYVNLETTTLQKVIPVSADAFRLAVSRTHIFVFPRRDQWSPVRVLNIATGVETTWNHIYAGETGGRISPDGRYLYVNGTKRYDIRSGVPPSAFDAVSGLCFDMWFTEDGQRLLTRCGDVLRLSETQGQEIQYSGRLWEGLTESATHSSARKLIAALRSSVVFGANGTEDTAIHLFADDFISPRGTVAIPKQQVGPSVVTMHGRYVFWNNSGTRLYTIVQADPAAGVLQDYSIYILSADAQCGVTLPASASVDGTGGTGTVSISAADGCVWFASSNSSWLTVVQNSVSAGSASLTYAAEPNPTTTPRTGTLQIAGQTFTITQAAGSVPSTGPAHVLPFRVIDAEYSSSLDRMIGIADTPNSLNIYDPLSRTNTRILLPLVPTSLALSLDGLRAAVGHDGSITIVNLQSAAVEKVLPVSINVYDLALAPNNWVHASMQSSWGTAVSVNIATGVETKQDLLYRGEAFAIHPNGSSLYSVGFTVHPAYIHRFSLTEGPLQYLYVSPYYDGNPICGPLWFTTDSRILTGCGVVLRTAATEANDLKYAGRLSGISGQLRSAAHSAKRRTIAVLPDYADQQDAELTLHNDEFLSLTGRLKLPAFPVTGTSIKSRGRHVFWNSASTHLFVVMQAVSGGGLNDFALYTIAPGSGTCSVTFGSTSATVPAAGTTSGSVAVTAAADCTWEARTSASWITITGGLAGAGPGNITYTVAPNLTTVPRTGTITAGGQTFTITQAAGDGTACTPTLSTPSSMMQATGATDRVDLTIAAGCAWTTASSVSWVQVFPGSGTGSSSSISYTVYPNYTTSNRSGTITIAGRPIQVTQSAAAGTPDERFIGLMYFNSLGRVPSKPEVDFHTRNLTWMSRTDTIMNFIQSEEFNRAARFIAGLYVGILGRDAEFGGWLFQRNAMVTGWTSQETLVPAFLDSPEFQLKYGTLTDPAFVQVLYRNVLGRDGSPAEIDYHAGALRSGTPRRRVAQSFLNAPEFRDRTDKRLTAFLLYSVLLLRSITPAEMAARVEQMNAGMTPAQLVEGIIQSAEFAALLR